MANITNRPQPNRLVIYTVLLGEKEALGSPLSELDASASTDLEIDFICITDNRNLTSDTWKFVYIENANLPPEKLSRRPKALPHEYLSDWPYSLYIDNIVIFKRLPNSRDIAGEGPYLFKVFLHTTRINPQQEADTIVLIGYDDVNTICRQLDFYQGKMPIESITPLHTCTVILRAHNHPAIINHGIAWWEHILCFSKRDQMSFDFARIQTGCHIDRFQGLKEDNDLTYATLDYHNNRVKANFDDVKYAWLHRQDPEAVQNPRAHFLAQHHESDRDYRKSIYLFEYICHKQRSSLGSFVAPRRSVANTLTETLNRYRQRSGNLLLIRICDENAKLGFSAEEFDPASSALSIMLDRHISNKLELSAEDISTSGTNFSNPNYLFDVIVLFGVPPEKIQLSFEKFAGLLNPEQGLLVIITSFQGNLAIIDATGQLISKRFAVECKISVNQSHHDSMIVFPEMVESITRRSRRH